MRCWWPRRWPSSTASASCAARAEPLPRLRHLAQAARLVRVATALAGEAPGELLERQDQEQRRETVVGGLGDGEANGAQRHGVWIAEHQRVRTQLAQPIQHRADRLA